ncbi:hypothetical protein Tco_0491964 [Tanacetum coccineum]
MSLRTTVLGQMSEIRELHAADPQLIDQGVTCRFWQHVMQTGMAMTAITSGMGGRRTERIVRECTYQDFMKCKPLYFKGTEGVVELTQWFNKERILFFREAIALWKIRLSFPLADLRKKMTDKYCPRYEMKKLEAKLWNLKVKGVLKKIERVLGGLPNMIHGNIVASKPKTMQEAVEMATELMDKKVSTIAERHAKNKRKFENTS